MYIERAHILDRLVSLWSRRANSALPVLESSAQVVPPHLQLNEHGRNRYQQEEWEAMWQLRDNLKFLKDYYGVHIRLGRGSNGDLGNVNFKRWTTPSIALEDVTILRRELAKYPPEFIQFCGITQLRFVQDLSLENHKYWDGSKSVGGLASSRGSVYIASYGADTIHHEIFHRADQQSEELNEKKQRKWKRLNRLSNPYLYRSYWDMTRQDRRKLPIDGFAKTYGRVDVWEDRATVAELLMSDLEKAEDYVEKDEVLANKAKRVIIDLYRWSRGKMNEQYFEDLKEGKVKEGYWQQAA